MRLEIKRGQPADVSGTTVSLGDVRVARVATAEGEQQTRRSATLDVGGNAIEVTEGSAFDVGNVRLVVTRVSRAKELVRLRRDDEVPRRFRGPIEGFRDAGAPVDAAIGFAIEGARLVDDVLGRIDDHPDTVGGLAGPLGRARRFLQHARTGLAQAGASPDLLAFVDRYLGVCRSVLDTVMSSTQEQEVPD